MEIPYIIREQITPKGDGNLLTNLFNIFISIIREQITPKGDGNTHIFKTCIQLVKSLH